MPLFSRKDTFPFLPRVASSGGTRPGMRYYMKCLFSGHSMDTEGGIYAYLVSTNIGRSVPGIQVTVPEIQLQPLGTPTKMQGVA